MVNQKDSYVRVSQQAPAYFELTDGTPYIPVGLNLAFPRLGKTAEEGLAKYEKYFQKLSENGGNYARIWLSHPFFDVEHAHSGVYDGDKARRFDAVLDLARTYGIRLKLCLEHFRTIGVEQSSYTGSTFFDKPSHHVDQGGCARTMTEFFTDETCRVQFKRKLAWFADRYGDDPIIFAWELWNEINAVRATGRLDWTAEMLNVLHARFPRNMALQSLGSFDSDGHRELYRRFSTLLGNDAAQVHRYLDPGAPLDICHGPMDMLSADTIRELRAITTDKPLLLAEVGGVMSRHSGPSELYALDTQGTLLHDALFAPFFAGAAGPGHFWHWNVYVEEHDLWHHFGRFTEAIKDVNPIEEQFVPLMIPHPRLRVYTLKGKHTTLLWCRDKQATWLTELVESHPAEVLTGMKLDLNGLVTGGQSVQLYDPWQNQWQTARLDNGTVSLPAFTRSIVVRIQ